MQEPVLQADQVLEASCTPFHENTLYGYFCKMNCWCQVLMCIRNFLENGQMLRELRDTLAEDDNG
jgi:hypothetical protein